MIYFIKEFGVIKMLYWLLEIKSMNIRHHISRSRSLTHKSVVQVVNRHDSEAVQVAPAFHWSNPISVCYVTAQASAWINTAITQISPLVINTHPETYFRICMFSHNKTCANPGN